MSSRSITEVQAARAFSLKNYARAIERLNELLEDVGENPHTLYLLALCHARLDHGAKAVIFAERALRADEQHLESLKLLAQLHILGGDTSQARHYVVRALAVAPADVESGPVPRGWLAGMMARLRAARHGAAPTATREHRQWLEWAEAFLARTPADDAD